MPEEEKQNEPMVDIDTSGPEVEVNVEEKENKKVEESKAEEQKEEVKVEEVKEETKPKEETEDKKKELEDYSEGVQKRIAKLTKKWREAERQKDAALDYAKSVKQEQESLKTKLSTIEPNYVNAMEGRVVSGLQAAQSQLAKAREAGDIAAEVEAQKMIARLGVEEARVANLKKQSAAKPAQDTSPTLDQAMAQTQPQTDPKAEAWAEKNPWFGTDSAMTYTAFDLHKKLVDEEGFDAQSDEYYSEIDKRMRLDFPHKFGTTDSTVTTKPTQTVASAKRSVNNRSQKTVRLTPSQVSIAKKLGVPLEEYAKQLKITKGA
jgi:predicted RNA-binding protein Jag